VASVYRERTSSEDKLKGMNGFRQAREGGALLDGGAGRRRKRRGVVRNEQPGALAEDKNIRCLDGGLIEAVGKSGGDMLGAGYPGDFGLDPYPNGAQRNPHALGICKDPRPTASHFVPAEQKLPTGLDALDGVVMRPHGFHLGNIERFECGVEPLIGGADGFFGILFLRGGLRGHEIESGKLRPRRQEHAGRDFVPKGMRLESAPGASVFRSRVVPARRRALRRPTTPF